MQEIHQNVYSKHSKKDTLDIFLNNYDSTRVLISDLDGTLHRGSNPKKYRGITNVDLAKGIAKQLAYRRPHKLPGFISVCRDIKGLESDLRGLDYPSSEIEEDMINFFFNQALKGLPYKLVQNGSKNMHKLAYSQSKETLWFLSQMSKDMMLVSKSFSPSILPYASWFQKRGINLSFLCNHIETDDKGKVARLNGHKMMTRKDKVQGVEFLLGDKPYTEALVFGDTDEDLGIVEALDNKGIDYKVIAVNGWNGHSDAIIEKADIYIREWKGLSQFLNLI